jgi:hypothetical protein
VSGGRTLDPEPWEHDDFPGARADRNLGGVYHRDPRPVIFASTATTPNVATAYEHDSETCAQCWGIIPPDGVTMVPEDGEVCPGHRVHEPNPILVAFREEVRLQHDADWLSLRSVANLTLARQDGFTDATPVQIAHARRVLTRLANFPKEN